MLDLTQVYIGMIIRNKDTYEPIIESNLMLPDPFEDMDEIEAQYGIPTLVRMREDGSFEDLINGRFQNELVYTIGAWNKRGIALANLEPFLRYFSPQNTRYIPLKDHQKIQQATYDTSIDFLITDYEFGKGECVCLLSNKLSMYANEYYSLKTNRPYNLKNYYLAIIKMKDSYYENENTIARLKENYKDPFMEYNLKTARKIGIPTIVKQEENGYYDVLYSGFYKDLFYHMQKYNMHDIALEHIEPFTNYYEDYTHLPMTTLAPQNEGQKYLQSFLPYTITRDPGDEYGLFLHLNKWEPLNQFYQNYKEKEKVRTLK